jgi:microcystin-dependent protein
MAEPYMGEIRMFGFNFAPVGWQMCNGQLLSISENEALFNLIGTTYGGNGTSTFALPDLRGRVAIHIGRGNGLSQYVFGQTGGAESVTLTQSQMPTHAHAVDASSALASGGRPSGAVLARSGTDIYAAAPDGSTTMNAGMIGTTGSNLPHPNIQPYLALNFCIALQGIFPSRS